MDRNKNKLTKQSGEVPSHETKWNQKLKIIYCYLFFWLELLKKVNKFIYIFFQFFSETSSISHKPLQMSSLVINIKGTC